MRSEWDASGAVHPGAAADVERLGRRPDPADADVEKWAGPELDVREPDASFQPGRQLALSELLDVAAEPCIPGAVRSAGQSFVAQAAAADRQRPGAQMDAAVPAEFAAWPKPRVQAAWPQAAGVEQRQ